MAVEGSLDLFGLPEILQTISQQNKTGILTVQGQQDIVAVSFLGGRIVAADSLAHTVDEGLGQVLVGEGLLDSAAFARASAENQAAGGRLQDLLVERGFLDRQQLLKALRLQTIRLLESLLRWDEGDFKFYGGDEVSYEDGFEPIAVEDLLLRMLVELGGRSRPAAPAPVPRPVGVPASGAAEMAAGAAASARLEGGGGAPGEAVRPAPPSRPGDSAAGLLSPVPPGSGSATQVRRPAGREPAAARATGHGEVRLPEIPELPEVVPPDLALPAAGGGFAPQPPLPGGAPSRPRSGGASGSGGSPAAEPLPWPAAALKSPPAVNTARAPAADGSVVPLVPPPRPVAAGQPPMSGGSGRPGGPGGRPRDAADLAGGGRGAGRPSPLPAAGGGGTATVRSGAVPFAAGMDAMPAVPPDASSGALAAKGKFRQMRIERTAMPLGPRLAAAALAVTVALLLAVAPRQFPASLALPFPWQLPERGVLVRNQREALFDKIDLAAKTAYLRDGRFPDRLSQLRDAGLLGAGDLQDPRGGPLLYSAREDSYSLQASEAGRPLADTEADESIAGNFLLDPSLLQTGPATGPPIVLLD
jgi:hypothetical protein